MTLKSIREHFKLRFSEWIIGLMLLLWGVTLLINTSLFEVYPAAFNSMSDITTQKIWGIMAIGIGLLRLIFLIINGTWRRSAHLRAIGSGLSACIWTVVWSSYLNSDTLLPGLWSVGALIALDLFSLWYAAEDAKHSDLFTKQSRS